jgi:hypothetical protein
MRDLTCLLGPGRHHMMAFAFQYDASTRRFIGFRLQSFERRIPRA